MITRGINHYPYSGKDKWLRSGVFGIRHDMDNKMSPDTINAIESCSYVPRVGVYWFNPWYDGLIYTKAQNKKELNEKIKLIESCL